MLNENLVSLRKRSRLSQEEVAARVGVSRQALAKWESGETIPDMDKCMKLAAIYNVSLDTLATYQEKTDGLPLPPKGKYLFGTVTVGEKGQIVIPKKARTIFDIQPGDQILVVGDEAQGLALMKTSHVLDFINQVHRSMEEGEQD